MQLFINTYGSYLHVKDKMFEIRLSTPEAVKKAQISPGKISSILLSSGTSLSSEAVNLALTNNIDIIFLEWDGKPLGRVWHSKLGSTTKIRKNQLIASVTSAGLEFTKEWISAKIINQSNLLKSLRKHREEKAEIINEAVVRLEGYSISILAIEAATVKDAAEQIRGIEGTAGRIYFELLSSLLAKDYQFAGRSSRPAKDQFNAFLNYSYGILYSKIEKALLIAGVDPYLGFLHRDDYNQLSMVFDFIEPYRAFADEVVFKLFSGKKVNLAHTDMIQNGFTLNDEGKKLLVESYNNFFDEDTIRYKGKNHTRNNAIQYDAHTFANALLKNKYDQKEIGEYKFELE